ncbi:MAG TPA: Stk1 family PASTA domain-containing Ser/Thr kinase [Pilimelia sp.]|nr:Stk1 family PASTA domain-containing Ser/Thr kinase [Pilimelia sp.]
MDTQVADPLLGSLIDGRYRVRGRVARGGMATVYSAVDERLERTVALKIIHPSQLGQAHFVDRFTDEAKTIARLTHPNVVAVYDQGNHAGLPYLVMEYVRGRTLRDILAQRRRLSPPEALAILEQMLAAIATAHRAGLVHRDVKPENVLIAEAPSGGTADLLDSVVKVADFGLARAVEACAEEVAGGQLMATVAYVAPELVTDGHADPRTDVYSAGIVLFEMLTGRVPYDGASAVDVAWQHVDQDVPPPSRYLPDLPPALDALVAHATRRDPGARPTDAGALLAQVQAVRDDLGSVPAVHAGADRTMVVSAVRPAWARLPAGQPGHSAGGAAPDGPGRAYRGGGRRPGRGGALGAAAARWHGLVGRVAGTPRARTALTAATVVLALLVVAGGWWFGFGRYTVAPELVNLDRANAEARAAQAGFTVVYGEPRFSEDVERDVVLGQDPPGRGRIVKGGQITLVLSRGPERYPVPDVLGRAYERAEADLAAKRLVVKKGPDRYDDNVPVGVVMAVDPAVGTQVKPGTTVTVTVSKGRAPITVPRVTGKNIAEARTALEQLGLTVFEEYKDSDKPQGEVIDQDPADGSGVEQGAEIRLKVSKGPPAVVVPRVLELPCPQAKQVLEGAQLKVRVDFNPNGIVRYQNPGENSQVPPGTEVAIGCL